MNVISFQRCLVVVLVDTDNVAGVCAFCNDSCVEYFVEPMPGGAKVDNPGGSSIGSDAVYRAVVAAASHWSPKWVYANEINFLSQDRKLVK